MKPLPSYLPNRREKKTLKVRQKGFTLVEVIVSIVILGILGVFMSMGIARIIEGYMFTRDNADTALKGQIAFARMSKELRSIEQVNMGDITSLTYSYNRDGNSIANRTIAWAGSSSPLLLGGNILTDEVKDFKITYYNSFDSAGDNNWMTTSKLIHIALTLQGASDEISSFSTWILPRNL